MLTTPLHMGSRLGHRALLQGLGTGWAVLMWTGGAALVAYAGGEAEVVGGQEKSPAPRLPPHSGCKSAAQGFA